MNTIGHALTKEENQSEIKFSIDSRVTIKTKAETKELVTPDIKKAKIIIRILLLIHIFLFI